MKKEQPLWGNEPEIVTVFAKITEEYDTLITKNDAVTGMDTIGYTAAKDNVFDRICAQTLKLCRKMSGFAKTRNDLTLLPNVDVSLSSLSRGPELEVIARCAGLVDLAEKRITDFQNFKVTIDEINNIRQLFKEYDQYTGSRSNVKNDKTSTGKEIDVQISNIRTLLDTLDDLVEGLMEDDAFISRYKASRAIIDYGKGKTLKNQATPKPEAVK
jgi:hypothetical protein